MKSKFVCEFISEPNINNPGSHMEQHTYSKDQSTSLPDQSVQDVSTTPSASNTWISEPHQIMLHHESKLITALSADPLGIAGILLAKEFIPEHTKTQMRQCSTAHEKATILVTAVRQRIEIAPKRFHEFLDVLSKQAWTRDILKVLQSSTSSLGEDPHQIMLRYNDKLITALSADPLGIAGILLAKGLIPEHIEAQMRHCSTAREKATILVTVVRQRIEIAPKRFHEFLDVLSKQAWTRDILKVLQSSTSSLSEDPHQIMLRHENKFITALSADPLGIAGILLIKGLIPEHTEAQMQQCSTPREKATILVTAVRQRIEIAPKRFHEFLDVLSKQAWTRDILKVLQSSTSSLSEYPHQIMLRYNDKLITALSADPLGIAGILLVKGLIPEHTEVQMRQCSTAHEKATILVIAVRQMIKIAPKRFREFLDILSEQAWTKDILEILQSSTGSLSEDPHQIMLRHENKLITALSADPLGIAGILLAKELIPEHTKTQMRQCSTAREKATILVTAVRQRIEIAPKRFHEFLDILSEQAWTKDILEILQSSTGSLSEDPHQIMLRYNDKLITALSADPLGIAGILLVKGLISEHTEALMQQCSTPREKATILVTAVRQRIEIAPKRFHEFLDVLSKQAWTRDILKVLQSSTSSLSEYPHQIMLRYNDKLITALSADPLGIAGILLVKGLIPEHTEVQMRQCSTAREKATILVIAVRQMIKIAPKRFHEFLDILSEQAWTKDILEILQSSTGSLSEDPHQIMLRHENKLITALSADPLGIAGILLAKELIPEHTKTQMRQCSTAREKATILVTAVRQRIEIAPKRFHEFLDILSEQAWTKDILEILQSSTGSLSEDPHQIMFRYNDKLITALSADPLGIAGILLVKGLISEHTEALMQQCSTPREKATLLVTAVRQRIEIAPKRFHEFISILGEQSWTKDIVELLLERNAPVSRTGEHTSFESKPAKSTPDSEESSNIKEYTFPYLNSLNSDDEEKLEAQLDLYADKMNKTFAILLLKTINSFERQAINPRSLISEILAITENDDPSIGKPLLKREKEALSNAQNIDAIFSILRPHMSFFKYEILEFVIETLGSLEDRRALQTYLQEFELFCHRIVFEVPTSTLGSSFENAFGQQTKLCIKMTKQFRGALLTDRISRKEVQHIQRKLACVLKVTGSSLHLDLNIIGNGKILHVNFQIRVEINRSCMHVSEVLPYSWKFLRG